MCSICSWGRVEGKMQTLGLNQTNPAATAKT